MRRPRPTRAVEQWEKEWFMKLTLVLLKEQKMGEKCARGIARDQYCNVSCNGHVVFVRSVTFYFPTVRGRRIYFARAGGGLLN
jgi:hypothetical protein